MKSIVDFIHELAILKNLPRSGSFIAGVKSPDTVGEHVFRATQIAFFLAELEGGNGERACFLVSIHDNPETRIGDLNKVQLKYFPNKKDAEVAAFYDQIENLPKPIALKMQSAFEEFEAKKTVESKCAHDADLLELAFEAKKLLSQGFEGKQNWLENISSALVTASGKSLFQEMLTSDSNDWWQGLKAN